MPATWARRHPASTIFTFQPPSGRAACGCRYATTRLRAVGTSAGSAPGTKPPACACPATAIRPDQRRGSRPACPPRLSARCEASTPPPWPLNWAVWLPDADATALTNPAFQQQVAAAVVQASGQLREGRQPARDRARQNPAAHPDHRTGRGSDSICARSPSASSSNPPNAQRRRPAPS